jgi:hypothetical protein
MSIFRRKDGEFQIIACYSPQTYNDGKTLVIISRGKLVQKKKKIQYIAVSGNIHAVLMSYDEGKLYRWYDHPSEAANKIQTEEGADA